MTETRLHEMCACGMPLHYASPLSERLMREVVAKQGATVKVVAAGGLAYDVPRHYIALHGLAAVDLDALAARYGWPRS